MNDTVRIPHYVVTSRVFSRGAIALFTTLKLYTNKQNECWPSIGLLADDMRCTAKSIITYLDELEKGGAVIRLKKATKHGNHCNKYVLVENPEVWQGKPKEKGAAAMAAEKPSKVISMSYKAPAPTPASDPPRNDDRTEKKLESAATGSSPVYEHHSKYIVSDIKSTTDSKESQEGKCAELYSLDIIKDRFGYDQIFGSCPKELLDLAYEVLHESLIRDPDSCMNQLNALDIKYAIGRYEWKVNSGEPIQKERGYMRTLLEGAKEQRAKQETKEVEKEYRSRQKTKPSNRFFNFQGSDTDWNEVERKLANLSFSG